MIYECLECKREFNSYRRLGSHRKNAHCKSRCQICDSVVATLALQRHVISCKKKHEEHICRQCQKVYLGQNKFCSQSCMALFNNALRGPVSLEQKRKVSLALKGRMFSERRTSSSRLKRNQILSNLNLPLTDITNCIVCKKEFNSRGIQLHCSRKCTNLCSIVRKNLSDSLRGKCGGIRKGSGCGKSGHYLGIWCDSSWELAWVIFHIENNISFERNDIGFDYEFEGKIKKYYPDFIIDSEFIEIKGYKTAQFEAKLQQFPGSLKVLYKKGMQLYLKYAIEKHGKDFIKLYDIN